MERTRKQLRSSARRKYLLALGEFVDGYSFTEAVWHWALRKWAGIDQNITRAMTGGIRGGEVLSALKRILKVVNIDKTINQEISSLIEQFNTISEFRDRLIHRGAHYDPDFSRLISTNEYYYKVREDFESLTFGISDIENAHNDVVMIGLRLILCALPEDSSGAEQLKKNVMKWTHAPWRYKRLRPDTPNLASKVKEDSKTRAPASRVGASDNRVGPAQSIDLVTQRRKIRAIQTLSGPFL